MHNCLARVVTRSHHISQSAPLLRSLHWLPVRYRIIFKICAVTYQALSSNQPAYVHSRLTPAKQPRQLRSSNSSLLFVPSIKTNAFSIAAPTLWKSLPVSVKSIGNIATFRHKVNTHLFKLAYPPYPTPTQHTNPTVYNWNCLSIMNCLTPFVLVRCRAWVS